MAKRYSPTQLRALRNSIPIDKLISNELNLLTKQSDGHLRFLCPLCRDFHTATNPKTNLARCFKCQKNFNPIDIVMTVHQCTFVEAVKLLTPFLPL
ncbi:MAG: hypothetical protein GY777_26020 [Candidatus Brocadiaceae bacterium]|nr:hypothetical protein [Candidatus Brocadiaceae bacterium]